MQERFSSFRPAEILLVEDSQDDFLLTKEGFKRAKLEVRLHHVNNGEECMSFLRKRGEYAAAPIPDLILLDLNMPVMDGREVLEQIVSDPQLNNLPVVVLTTSEERKDILKMYSLRCSSYIVKPVDFQQFMRVIQGMNDYWFSLVALPSYVAAKAEK
jgi:chemotaxis family two-component system response regulator Rcp1